MNVRAKVRELCLALEGASEETGEGYSSYRVKKKVFAYFLINHHGDGITGLWVKVLPGDNTALIEAAPERFYRPAYVAHHGYVGYRLDVEPLDWEEVSELLKLSYELTAKPTGSAGGSRRRR